MVDIISQLKMQKKTAHLPLSDYEVADKLRASELPLFLWGCGNYAEYIYGILSKNKIAIDGVFIDAEPKSGLEFHGHKVVSFKEVESKYSRINIIRGNGNIEQEVRYRSMPMVETVYCFFDLMGFGWHINDEKINQYADTINAMYNAFADDTSRESFASYLKSRYFGSWTYIQPHVCEKMYFPDFIELSGHESFIDCGAFDGDTLKLFSKKISTWDNYFAFEPSIKPYDALCNYIADNKFVNVHTYKTGVWNKKTTLSFVEENDISRIIQGEYDSGIKIEVDALDNICGNVSVTYIKMDLEGSELDALEGAKNTILKNKPKLAISLYHKRSHLVDIYKFVSGLNLEYNFYFRIHTKVGSDAVLYAV
ncbi:MAG: FkbM family methyltransferase [Bacteroidetes bacterium]|nr:FkbM family methyltransferase [Bacteroidota bacterium]